MEILKIDDLKSEWTGAISQLLSETGLQLGVIHGTLVRGVHLHSGTNTGVHLHSGISIGVHLHSGTSLGGYTCTVVLV
jgi:hypothetical protein